jgi:hypothetical protein
MFSAAIKSGAAGNPTDPKFNYVTMLLHGDGTNGAQNNTFVDSSTNNFTITRNGNTTQGTFTPYGSNWSNYFDGTGDYLSVANNAALQWSTGDFCVEAWIYPNSVSGSKAIVCKGINDTGTFDLGLYGTKIELYTTALVFSSSASLSANTWTHVAITRSGTTLRCFINGALDTTVTSSYNFNNAGTFYVGVYGSGSVNYFNGYMSNVRCVKGSAVYTSAFTPSTTSLTAITNTSLLTCQSNRFIDNSTNNFTITKNGDVSVQRFSPFSPTTAYSTSVIGGSGYFDGSGDYLTAPNSTAFDLSTSDFTLEGFFYPTTGSAFQSIFAYASNAGASISDYAFQLLINSTNGVNFRVVASGSSSFTTISTSNTITLNSWNYVCVTRTGTSVSVYLNGTTTTGTIASTIRNNASSILTIGRDPDGTFAITGYLSNLRILKGTAVTPSTPTAPLTAITNTSLLLSYTNAGILDNAMMNDLETVGNAQISTSVKKYGTGSMYFDGSGDYLLSPSVMPNSLGSGDFTVEFWVYVSAYVDGDTPLCIGTFGTWYPNIMIRMNTNWTISVGNGSSWVFVDQGFGTKAIGSWAHIAITRSSGTLRAFLNGVQGYSVSNSTDMTLKQVVVGNGTLNNLYFNGYIDDLRITKGYARYTANFSVPTAAFPNN